MVVHIVTFNARGLRDPNKRKKVFQKMKKMNVDVVMLQETHSTAEDSPLWEREWGGRALFAHGTNMSRGVAILCKQGLDLEIEHLVVDEEGRFLILKAKLNGIPYLLTNIYGPNTDNADFFIRVFNDIADVPCDNRIIAGDFNVVLGNKDYFGAQNEHANRRSKAIIHELMEEYDLIDIWREMHTDRKEYTRHQNRPRCLSRIDFFLVSRSIRGNCTKSEILPGVISDHSMVVLKLKDVVNTRGPGQWKLNVALLRDAEYLELIKQTIRNQVDIHTNGNDHDNPPPDLLWDTIKSVIAGVTISYATRKKRDRDKQKKDIENEILDLHRKIQDPLCPAQVYAELQEAQGRLNEILNLEIEGAKVRSKVTWAKYGEKCSQFFCNLERNRSQKKTVTSLKLADDTVTSNHTNVMKRMNMKRYDFS